MFHNSLEHGPMPTTMSTGAANTPSDSHSWDSSTGELITEHDLIACFVFLFVYLPFGLLLFFLCFSKESLFDLIAALITCSKQFGSKSIHLRMKSESLLVAMCHQRRAPLISFIRLLEPLFLGDPSVTVSVVWLDYCSLGQVWSPKSEK